MTSPCCTAPFRRCAPGAGRLVLVSGEAGIGKTALVNAFCASVRGSSRVLEGSCDALATPRALGAFVDLRRRRGRPAARTGGAGVTAARAVPGAVDELGSRPGVIVLEDVHWADEATLDVLRVLGRRIESVRRWWWSPTATRRVGAVHPVRILLGDLAPRAGCRVALDRSLPQPSPRWRPATTRRGRALPAHRRQPVLRARGAGGRGRRGSGDRQRGRLRPRSAHEPDARSVLEAVSVAPPALEPWALEASAASAATALDECLAGGMLVERGSARSASATSSRGWRSRRRSGRPSARPASRAAGGARRLAGRASTRRGWPITPRAPATPPPCSRLRPRRPRRAAALGAHREAAAQYARALRFARALRRRARRAARHGWRTRCMPPTTRSIDRRARSGDRALPRGGDVRRRGGVAVPAGRRLRLPRRDGRRARGRGSAVRAAEPLGRRPVVGAAYDSMALLALYEAVSTPASSGAQRGDRDAQRCGDATTLVRRHDDAGSAELLRDGRGGVRGARAGARPGRDRAGW